jgi:hypothetical protein
MQNSASQKRRKALNLACFGLIERNQRRSVIWGKLASLLYYFRTALTKLFAISLTQLLKNTHI